MDSKNICDIHCNKNPYKNKDPINVSSNSEKDNMKNNIHVIKFNEENYSAEKQDDLCSENIDSDNESDIISEYIGHMGKWQLGWAILLYSFQFPNTFHIFAFVFQAAEKEFWCARPDDMLNMDVNMWRNMTQPKGSCSMLNFSMYDTFSSDINKNSFFSSSDNSLNLTNCNKFEFDENSMGATLISEWNLVCDRANLLSVVEMCFLAGAAIGSICSGWVSDQFGRRHSLMIFASIQAVIGTALTFSNSLAMFMALRVVIGFASMSVINISFVLVVELVSGKWRTIIGILNILPVALSYIIMAGIAFITRNWRTTQLVISIPGFFLLLMWYFLPESPRWLLARGRIDELKQIIEVAAARNNIYLPVNYESTLIPPKDQQSNVSFLNLIAPKFRRTTFLLVIVWYSLILIYFGITLHLNNLGGDIYINTAIAGTVEAISICLCIFVVLKSGIKINLVTYMLVAGICCLIVNLIPDGNLWGIISLAMIVKCTIGATNALIPTFTAIQYPTTMRTLSMGAGNFAAGMALITVPYLWLLEHIQEFLPMSIMGVFGVIGAIGLLLMKDKKLSSNNDSSNKRYPELHGESNDGYVKE